MLVTVDFFLVGLIEVAVPPLERTAEDASTTADVATASRTIRGTTNTVNTRILGFRRIL